MLEKDHRSAVHIITFQQFVANRQLFKIPKHSFFYILESLVFRFKIFFEKRSKEAVINEFGTRSCNFFIYYSRKFTHRLPVAF